MFWWLVIFGFPGVCTIFEKLEVVIPAGSLILLEMFHQFLKTIGGGFFLWLVCLAVLGNAEGHSMKQVRSEITAGNGRWHGSVWLEAWALYPEDGPKIPPGVPGAPHTAGSTWLATLDVTDHATLRATAATFLGETFILTLAGKRLEVEYHFPDYSVERPPLRENADGNALVRIDLSGKLGVGESGPLELVWADDEDEPLALQVMLPGHAGKVLRLAPKAKAAELCVVTASGAAEPSEASSLLGWIQQGFIHILPMGFDHICFILGLFFLQPKVRPLLWQTSAFTLAHSITLALVVLGIFTLPSKIVEPMIAISIAYVGIENLWVKELKPWRIGLVFGLGLLHGMGFGSVMKELELPQGEILQPLIGFNLGVELGQMTVLAAAFAATFWLIKKPVFGPLRKMASAMIGAVGLYWTVQRIWGG
jgi:HupE / UreJ protein